RTRRLAGATAVVATLAVVATGAVLVGGRGDDARRVDPAPAPPAAADLGAVFSIGTEVYLDGAERSVAIADKAIKSFFYTSAGLVVRHGDNSFSDGGGPQRFSLVTVDGDVQPMDLVTEEVYHASDPSRPYLVYAEPEDGVMTAHVLDVRTGEDAVEVPLPDHSGGFAPIALSGDTLYVGDYERDRTFEVDVPTASVARVVDTRYDQVAGGRGAVQQDDGWTVVDVASGEVLLDVTPAGGSAFVRLSPDGRYASVVTEDGRTFDPTSYIVHDLESGTSVELPTPSQLGAGGWSNDGESLFSVDGSGTVTSCEAATGVCTDTAPALPVAPNEFSDPGEYPGEDPRDDLILGGVILES
ncbi:MAG: hypothetical protein JWN84_733, partial [Nocardioides sp.]|nr:hypothetical protein [Nocardioides sp.]